jgi:hypothetical protein
MKEIKPKVLKATERIGNSRVFLGLMICLYLTLFVDLMVFPLPIDGLLFIVAAVTAFGLPCLMYSDWKKLRRENPLLLYELGVPLPQELPSQLSQNERDESRCF